MSKGRSSTPQTTNQNVTTTSLPEEFRPYLDRTLARGEAISNRPYEAYTGQRLADFSGDTNASFEGVRGNQGAWQPYISGAGMGFGQAMGTTAGVSSATWDTPTAQRYMNPYLNSVLDQQRIRQRDAFEQQVNANDAAAVRAGAFGGSRQGVMQAIAERAFNQQMNETEARAMSEAYDRAQSTWGDEQSRRLSAAGQMGQLSQGLAGLGQQRSEMGYADADELRRSGLTQEQLTQAGLDIAYNDFTNQRDYDRQNLTFLSGLINGSPVGSSSDVTSMQFSNPYAQALGLGLGLYGTAQNMGRA